MLFWRILKIKGLRLAKNAFLAFQIPYQSVNTDGIQGFKFGNQKINKSFLNPINLIRIFCTDIQLKTTVECFKTLRFITPQVNLHIISQ